MIRPRVLVLRAPGTNCDAETRHAFQQAGADAQTLHVNRWFESPTTIADSQILCIPGGFSYGDDLAAGRIFAQGLKERLGEQLVRFRDEGGLILGICNGFQVLLKSGLLDHHDRSEPVATLAWNDSGRFVDRWAHLRVASPLCVFLKGLERLYLPVAHAEGRFQAIDQAAFDELDQSDRLVLRYAPSAEGEPADNPNGSMGDVAGMCDGTGRVFGLMPHPERYLTPVQHPSWTRAMPAEPTEGMAIFQNAVRHFA